MSDADLTIFFASKQINELEALDKPDEMDVIFTEIVLELLAKPDVSEDSYSVKWDRKALERWYSIECSKLGIPDLLKDSDLGVKDISYLA
ncbi:hypothetical protein EG343_11075 [Chryseobacterium nakagawai]|uniref:Uncharacterized protein n=2 Tax=Chryseobacterium nakagawai TaxID=1241982 RepID=A0AAD0YJT6_CHRNA|nr:hypothetical protein EG343_11075 [Chryseobacterium nakagawai]